MALNHHQRAQLLRPLDRSRVQSRDGQSHLAAWDVRRWLNRIFGFGNWSADVIETVLVYEDHNVTVGREPNLKPAVEAGYRCTLRLTINDPDGRQLATYTEVAFGDAKMGVANRGGVHDFAIKTAESQALKRCAINLGDQFGLSLYNGGTVTPVVVRTLDVVDETAPAPEPDAPVTHDPDVLEPPAPDETPEPPPSDETDGVDEPVEPEGPDIVGLRDRIIDAGRITDTPKRRRAVAKLSIEVGHHSLGQTYVPEYGLTFETLIQKAIEGGHSE